MKISNRFVEIEFPEDETNAVKIRFPNTNTEVTITLQEAKQLWIGLDHAYGD